MKGEGYVGINTKGFAKKNAQEKKADPKIQLERDLKSCMRCKYFYGHNSGCLKNKKCAKRMSKREKELLAEKKKSKCYDCPYGKDKSYCFPCIRELLGK